MKSKPELRLALQVSSERHIWIVSLLSGFAVFSIAIFLQWLIYDDWMHRGSLRVVGSTLAAFLTFVFVLYWRRAVRRQKIEILHRFERIRWMNDRIRNSLQTIECLIYARDAHATDPVRGAVDAIEDVLHEVFVESSNGIPTPEPSFEPGSEIEKASR